MGLTASELEHILTTYIKVLKENISLEKVILFGSYANGKASDRSDIDLAIVSPDFGDNVLEDLGLLARLRRHADFRIQAFAYTPDELAKCPTTSFLHEILKHGVVVYSDDQPNVRLNIVADSSSAPQG